MTETQNSRLPPCAASLAEVTQYYQTRARQFGHEGWVWHEQVISLNGAFRTEFEKAGQRYVSYYLPPASRGKGLYGKLLAAEKLPVVTTKDCHIEAMLQHLGHPYALVEGVLDTMEYQLIGEFYGDGRARRSQAFLMNHIDEGLAILSAVGASTLAKRAYCLHPLVQGDTELQANFEKVVARLAEVSDGGHTLALAMEYRNVANAYLAAVRMPEKGIRLSPLADVNAMLVADKVQNRKDFQKFHASTHPNRARLDEYFKQWCTALSVSEDAYNAFVRQLPRF